MEAIGNRGERAKAFFLEGYNCNQAILRAFEDFLPKGEVDTIVALGSGFGGGMGRLREVCGAMTACFMILDLLYGYSTPDTGKKKIELYQKVQQLAAEFEKRNGSIICRDLLGLKEGKDSPVPEERTTAYYAKRPCGDIIKNAAELLEEYLLNESQKELEENNEANPDL